MHIKCT